MSRLKPWSRSRTCLGDTLTLPQPASPPSRQSTSRWWFMHNPRLWVTHIWSQAEELSHCQSFTLSSDCPISGYKLRNLVIAAGVQCSLWNMNWCKWDAFRLSAGHSRARGKGSLHLDSGRVWPKYTGIFKTWTATFSKQAFSHLLISTCNLQTISCHGRNLPTDPTSAFPIRLMPNYRLCAAFEPFYKPSYCQQDAPYLLESVAQSFSAEDVSVRLSILSAAAKLFLKRPPECQLLLGAVLSAGASDGNQDVHDRALMYYRWAESSSDALPTTPHMVYTTNSKCCDCGIRENHLLGGNIVYMTSKWRRH